MKVDLEDLGPIKRRISVEVPAEEVERATESVLRGYRKKARIPGFRPGKTPLGVIRKRFGKEVREDVRDRLVSQSFAKATEDNGLRPVGDPSLEDLTFEEGGPLLFKSTFEVLPKIEVRGYQDVSVRRPSCRLEEGAVDGALEEIRQSRARHVYEKDRKALAGDIVVADVEGTPEAGETFHRERTAIEVGARGNLPAFNENLEGAVEGDEVDFKVEYPEDYPEKALAGKPVTYRLKVCEIKRRELPELDDEFAKDLGEFAGLAELREKVEQDLQARRNHEADRQVRQSVLDKVLLDNTIAVPESLTEIEIRRRLEEIVRNMIMQGMDPEKSEVDWKQMRKQQEEPARKAVHARLVLDAVASVEKIAVDRRQVEERIELEARRIGESADKLKARLKKQGGLETLRAQLLRDATLDYLTSVANIQNEE